MSQPGANASLPHEVARFLEEHTTLALATVGPSHTPAVAPLFYAVLPEGDIVFLSERDTEHAYNLERSPEVALSIYKDAQPWQRIRGMQAKGYAERLAPSRWPTAWRAYSSRFPFVAETQNADALTGQLVGALAKARWYVVRLMWIRLIDNTRGFGWKAEWQRTPKGWERIR